MREGGRREESLLLCRWWEGRHWVWWGSLNMEEAKGSVARCVSIGEASGGEWTALLLGELSGELAKRGVGGECVYL